MFTKFRQQQVQLKPIGRSSSEQRRENSQPKPNYHFTQKRDKSEGKPIIHKQQEDELLGSVPVKHYVMDQQLQKSNSNQDLKKDQFKQLKSRIIIDTNKRPPRVPPMKKQDDKLKLKLNAGSISNAGFDGVSKKVNQDRALIYKILEDQGAFGVFDGHGQDGEHVSQYVKDQIQQNVQQYFKLFDFVKIFHDIHNKMKNQYQFGTQYSGTTATLILIRESNVFCGWVGDSRAIICSKGSNIKELSIDHKPFLEKERLRIEAQGGCVDTYHLPNGMPIGPARVWVKGFQIPGLAMSRSLGDQLAASVGVSQTPDITHHQLNQEDQYIILGSDGLWEFMSNEHVAQLVQPFYLKNDVQGACQKLYEEATLQWKQNSECIDDITVIVIFIAFQQ